MGMVIGKPFGARFQFFVLHQFPKRMLKGFFVKDFFKLLPVVVQRITDAPQGPGLWPPKAAGEHGTLSAKFQIEIRTAGCFVERCSKMVFIYGFMGGGTSSCC